MDIKKNCINGLWNLLGKEKARGVKKGIVTSN